MLVPMGSPRSGSPKRWGGGGSSPILAARSHHIARGLLAGSGGVMGGGGGVRGSPLPSRPPHLPHPRSRSLDTALDKASDSNAPMEGTTPHSGSVAGSLTDSAMPDSVPGSVSGSLTYSTMPNSVVGSVAGSLTDSTMPDSVQPSGSVSDVTAATSDTDASDSGVFSRYQLRGSKGSLHKGTHKKPSSNSKSASDGNSIPTKSSFRRANKNVLGSREDLRSSGRHRTKSVKNTSDVPSGKVKPKSDKAPAKAESIKVDDVNKQPKIKTSSDDSGDKASKMSSHRSLDKLEDRSKFSEVDPYNNFYSKKIAAKQNSPAAHSVKSVPCASKERPLENSNGKFSQDILGSERPRRNGSSNPYISPVISSIGRRERSPQPSSPSPSPSSSASGLRSPSLISSSSTSSLPYKKKESLFTFPRQTNTLTSDVRRPLLGEENTAVGSPKLKSVIPQSHASREVTPTRPSSRGVSSQPVPDTPVHKSESNGVQHQKETCSSPFDVRPRYAKNIRKPSEDIDLRKEGSHIDLVASCEKYLEEEDLHNVSDDESTLASTRRSSISSLGSSSGRLRRRLSSIPLDDDLTIAEEGQSSPTDIPRESPAKSCGSSSPHEMAIFSAIHALSQSSGGFASRDTQRGMRHSGDYDGVTSQHDVKSSLEVDDESPSSQDSSRRSPSSSSCASATPLASKKTTLVSSHALSNPSHTLPSKPYDIGSSKVFDQQNTLPVGVSLTSRVGPSSESGATTQPSSSLLDKCVNRVKTFIKK